MDEIKVESELRFIKVKRDNLSKAMEQVKSHTSDILIFNLQWSDVEYHLKLLERKVEERFRDIQLKEKEFDNRSFAFEERAKAFELAKAEVGDLEFKSDGFRIEIEEKRKELDSLRNQVELCLSESTAEEVRLTQIRKSMEECTVEERSKTCQLHATVEKLRKTEVELELKGEQLAEIAIDLERHHVEVSTEKEHLARTQTCRRELEEELERKMKDLTLVLDKIEQCEKVVETRSLELREIQGELEVKEKQLEKLNINIERNRGEVSSGEEQLGKIQDQRRELEEGTERMRKDLAETLDRIAECGKQLELVEEKLDSQQKLLETRSLEVISKERKLKGLSLDLDLREHMVKSLNDEFDSTCQQMDSKAKELEDIQRLIKEQSAHFDSIKLLIEEHSEELASKEKKQNEIMEAIHKLTLEIYSKKKTLEKAKAFIEQLAKKQHAKEKELDSTERQLEKYTAEFDVTEKKLDSVNDTLRECLQNLEIKEKELKSLQSLISEKNKHHDQVQSSITDLTTELKSKECDLFSLKKKIQDSLTLKASLMEREQELQLKEKQLSARSEKNDLKEKELDAREESINEKDQQLKSMEQKLAKCVKDYEQKAKKLSSFCQQSKPDQYGNLVQDANVSDDKTLQLLLHGHLKKCYQLYVDVSRALKASSNPAKLVLDTIQSLYSAQQRMAITSRDPNGVRRSSMCLLECLMDMSTEVTKPKTEVQEEAIKFAIEWKNTILVKEEDPVEVLNFLHFVGAFSLAYTFDADKLQNVFDISILRKHAASLCEALGVSALASVNSVLSLDDKPEQQPPSHSRSPGVQEITTSSHLGNEDALRDLEGSASFEPNEVSTKLPLLQDPGRYVLTSIEDALVDAHQRGELGLAEPMVKILVSFLEELPHVVTSINPHLKLDATKVGHRWSAMMRSSGIVSRLEAWCFLQFIVAFGLVNLTKQDEILRFVLYVAEFKHAPKLFQSLGLRYPISDFVNQLISEGQYIPAVRFMLSFKLMSKFSPLEYLKEEIIKLKRSAKEKRRFESQVEDRNGGKLRDIIEVIDDFKLDIDLPVDLIVKFMVPRETQSQSQPSLLIQAPQIIEPVHHMQAVIHSSYIATHSLNLSHPTSFGAEAGGSSAFLGQSYDRAGFKRPRVDPRGSRPAIRPCFNPSGNGRF